MTGGAAVLGIWLTTGTLAVAAALSAVLIVMLAPLLRRYALARPNARSSHDKPTPQGGGIAVIASTLAVTIGAALLGGGAGLSEALVVLAAAALMAVIGGIDDLRPLPVLPRLLLQSLAIVATLAMMPADAHVLPLLPWWVERLGLFIGLLWFVNLVNFMDGIDWMTVAEVVPVAAAIALIGLGGTIPAISTILDLALLGAVLGFAPFNKPVAKLFLGDVGSLPIGLLLGWLLLQLARQGEIAAALLLPLYYLSDATHTLARRVLAGEPFWTAHRTHFYQRACDLGFSVPEIVVRVFLVNLALAALAFASVAYHAVAVLAGTLAGGCVVVAWLLMSFARGKHTNAG